MSLANDVVRRFKVQYPIGRDGIKLQLDKLGAVKNPDDVDRIIGNNSWTSVPRCSECGNEKNSFVVIVGEEPYYESNTAYLCGDCIKKAAALVYAEAEPLLSKEVKND